MLGMVPESMIISMWSSLVSIMDEQIIDQHWEDQQLIIHSVHEEVIAYCQSWGSRFDDWHAEDQQFLIDCQSYPYCQFPWINNRWLPLHIRCERLTVNPLHVDCWSPTPIVLCCPTISVRSMVQLAFSRIGFIFSIILPWFGYCY